MSDVCEISDRVVRPWYNAGLTARLSQYMTDRFRVVTETDHAVHSASGAPGYFSHSINNSLSQFADLCDIFL